MILKFTRHFSWLIMCYLCTFYDPSLNIQRSLSTLCRKVRVVGETGKRLISMEHCFLDINNQKSDGRNNSVILSSDKKLMAAPISQAGRILSSPEK